jgi:DNA-directed RNA polymerase specialized sigma24 family protein
VAMPAHLRQVIVLRDIEGGSPADVQRALGVSPDIERALLQQARALVRARLEQHFEGRMYP